MRVVLDRKTVIELYCCCRQAERSLHRACDPANAWSALQEYYDNPKRDGLRLLQGKLQELLPVQRCSTETPTRDRLGAAPTLWRVLTGSLFGRWRKAWAFSEHQIQFIKASLERLFDLLATARRPESESLQARRQELADCQGIIEARCVGLRELKRARAIAHFDQASDNKGLEISDLLPDAA